MDLRWLYIGITALCFSISPHVIADASPMGSSDIPLPSFTDARSGFAAATFAPKYDMSQARIPGFPWPLHRGRIERPYAFQRDTNHPSLWRFETRLQDAVDQGGNVHEELVANWAYSPPYFDGAIAQGADFWASWSFMVELGPPTTAAWTILGQFHQTEDNPTLPSLTAPNRLPDQSVSPPIAINLVSAKYIGRRNGEYLTITSRSDSAPQQLLVRNPPERFEWKDSIPFKRDQWHHIVIHGKFGWNNDGLLQVWIDGVIRVDKDNYSVGYNDIVGPHLAIGIYRGIFYPNRAVASDTNNFAVQYANPEFSYSSLFDRVASPQPP